MPTTPGSMEIASALLFALALIHTFAAPQFERLAQRFPRHSGLFHLLGEVEVVFGFWAIVLVLTMALIVGSKPALSYAESRDYTEPLFVFVVMVISASRPILQTVLGAVQRAANIAPCSQPLAVSWLGLAIIPLCGSLITEPAAMTIAALILAPVIFKAGIPEGKKYFALGVLFVNISIGGTLTSYAAPPVLMVAEKWNWNSAFMFTQFGWKAAIAVLINASIATFVLRSHLNETAYVALKKSEPIPLLVVLVHIGILIGVIVLSHHPVAFLALLLLFIGFTHAYERYQNPLIVKEALLVAFFLAGLVVIGGLQTWWLQPIVKNLDPLPLFFGALTLTAFTDNAALTYLGSQIEGMTDAAKYMLVSGAVAGGGLTVIANAPNPAGAALLKAGFSGESIGPMGLLIGALVPTVIAAAVLVFL